MIHEMKGEGETVMVGGAEVSGLVELSRFADGSWGIRKRGVAIGVWEWHERDECLRVFNMLAGVGPAEGRRGVRLGEDEAGGNWN